MNRIVIIGNGFDLAHKLETSYNDFIKYAIKESINHNDEIREELVDVGYLMRDEQTYTFIMKNFNHLNSGANKPTSGKLYFKNKFFRSLLAKYFTSNWIDIESYYFKYLGIILNGSNDIEKLNREFELIKKHLKIFLSLQQENDKNIIDDFIKKFSEGKPKELLFLNFNYTNTLEKYLPKVSAFIESKIVYIHGKLNSKENPIIFGYGDDTATLYNSLISKDNAYLRNLKRQQYNLAASYDALKKFLNKTSENEVYIIGHSLGLSDKTLLKEILEHKHVNKIKLFYFKDIEGYRSMNDNLTRIINRETMNNKVINFPNSAKVPQADIIKAI